MNDLERRLEEEAARELIELALVRVRFRNEITTEEEQAFRAVRLEEQQGKEVAELLGKTSCQVTRMHQKVFDRVAAEVRRIEKEGI